MTATVAAWIWAIGLVAWAVIRVPHRRRARRIKVVKDGRDIGDRLALALASVCLAGAPALYLLTGFPSFADFAFRPWMGWTGAILEALGLLLFYLTHRQLGRNWSVTLEIRDEHRLVTDGLYRYVRHPMYSSFWLWALSQAFLLPNWVAGFAGLVGVAVMYFSRLGKEERMMREAFGEAYDAYCARTGRIFPKIS